MSPRSPGTVGGGPCLPVPPRSFASGRTSCGTWRSAHGRRIGGGSAPLPASAMLPAADLLFRAL